MRKRGCHAIAETARFTAYALVAGVLLLLVLLTTESSGGEVDESTMREMYKALLQSFVKAALSGIDMGKRELEMLEMMRERLGPRFNGPPQIERENPKLAKARKDIERKKQLAKAVEEYKNRPGLSVTHISPDGAGVGEPSL